MTFRAASLAPLLLALAIAPPALADDRDPTPAERAAIEARLTALGYVSWEEIEMDDDRVWEIEDARTPDGTEWDLELDPASLEVLRQERDD